MEVGIKPVTLGIIPARGGSKGVPHKNIRQLAGQPLIVWTIELALSCPSLDRVIVSTDDDETASISQECGAELIWRPAEISGDTASSESALLHALDFLKRKEGYEPELVVFLQCTSPLTLSEDIEGTINVMLKEHANSALAVTPFHHFLWRRDKNNEAVGINHDKRIRPTRQQQEPQFLETGAVYAMRTKGFKQAKHRFFGKIAMHVMPPERCLEIDDPKDFLIAEVLMNERKKGS